MPTWATVALVSYLLGSIPFGYLLVRLFRGEDIRQSGSGNIGATNVARTAPLLGLVTLLLDAGKGFLAVSIAAAIQADAYASWMHWGGPGSQGRVPSSPLPSEAVASMSLAALCAVTGHIFSVWLKFRGGKGVATAIGSYAALAPDVTVGSLVIFLLLLGAFRFVSLASCTAIALFPLIGFFLHGNQLPLAFYGLSAASAVLIVVKHRGNLERILAGTEPRFGAKTK
jgi:glycerol-3-phosphate acyltransferase PlsY